MKVRAEPTWRNPVGEGAKRTRGAEAVWADIVLSMILAFLNCRSLGPLKKARGLLIG